MAQRPIFIPDINGYPYIKTIPVEFKWFPGMARSQAQKSIRSLHEAAAQKGYSRLLEISSKSEDDLGISLSAFNLKLTSGSKTMSVECAFQGSKVFEHGGAYHDLYDATSREAKKDERIRSSGAIIRFDFMELDFPVVPITLFYDWLYITAVSQNQSLSQQLLEYDGFTDIAFNPGKSWNCQARSAALYCALHKTAKLEKAVTDLAYYHSLSAQYGNKEGKGIQMGFGFS